MLYRSALLYRTPSHYQPGTFDLQYRNSSPYRVDARYRLGVDAPIGDTGAATDSHILVVTLDQTDDITVVEIDKPQISINPAWEERENVIFLEGTAGEVSFTLADTGSGTSTQEQGTSITDSDAASWHYGSDQMYRTANLFRSSKQYRGAGQTATIEPAVQADTGTGSDVTISFDNAITATEALSFLEAHGVDLSNTDTSSTTMDALVDLIVLSSDLASGTDLDIGGDRTFAGYGDTFVTADDIHGLGGEVAEKLSYLAVNRYRATPSRFKSR